MNKNKSNAGEIAKVNVIKKEIVTHVSLHLSQDFSCSLIRSASPNEFVVVGRVRRQNGVYTVDATVSRAELISIAESLLALAAEV